MVNKMTNDFGLNENGHCGNCTCIECGGGERTLQDAEDEYWSSYGFDGGYEQFLSEYGNEVDEYGI